MLQTYMNPVFLGRSASLRPSSCLWNSCAKMNRGSRSLLQTNLAGNCGSQSSWKNPWYLCYSFQEISWSIDAHDVYFCDHEAMRWSFQVPIHIRRKFDKSSSHHRIDMLVLPTSYKKRVPNRFTTRLTMVNDMVHGYEWDNCLRATS